MRFEAKKKEKKKRKRGALHIIYLFGKLIVRHTAKKKENKKHNRKWNLKQKKKRICISKKEKSSRTGIKIWSKKKEANVYILCVFVC